MVTQPSAGAGPIHLTAPSSPASLQGAAEGAFAQLLAEQTPLPEHEHPSLAAVAEDALSSEREEETSGYEAVATPPIWLVESVEPGEQAFLEVTTPKDAGGEGGPMPAQGFAAPLSAATRGARVARSAGWSAVEQPTAPTEQPVAAPLAALASDETPEVESAVSRQGVSGLSSTNKHLPALKHASATWQAQQEASKSEATVRRPAQVTQAVPGLLFSGLEEEAWSIWSGRLEVAASKEAVTPVAHKGGVAAHVNGAGGERRAAFVSGTDGPQEGVQEQVSEQLAVDRGVAALAGDGQEERGSHEGRAPAPMLTGVSSDLEKFEVSPGAVDFMKAAGESPAPVVAGRARAVVTAARQILPELTRVEAGASEARIELQVGEETLVIHVRVKDGAVDVELSGVSRADMARIREELAAQLPRAGLNMGQLRQGEDQRRPWGSGEREGWRSLQDEDEEPQHQRDDEPRAEPVVPHGRVWLKA